MVRVGFCPPTHWGKIMDLIRSDVKDLIGVVGPSILTEIRAVPAKAQLPWPWPGEGSGLQSVRQLAGLLRTLAFSVEPFLRADQHRGSERSLVMLPWSFSSFPCWSPRLWEGRALDLPKLRPAGTPAPLRAPWWLSAWVCEEKWERSLSGLQSSWSYPRLWLKSPVSGFINLGGGWLRRGHEAVFV